MLGRSQDEQCARSWFGKGRLVDGLFLIFNILAVVVYSLLFGMCLFVFAVCFCVFVVAVVLAVVCVRAFCRCRVLR